MDDTSARPGPATRPRSRAGRVGQGRAASQSRARQEIPPMSETSTVSYEVDGPVAVVTIERPQARNAVNRATARALATAFRRFDGDAACSVAILTGSGGAFCAGFDLKETAAGRRDHRAETGDAPMG